MLLSEKIELEIKFFESSLSKDNLSGGQSRFLQHCLRDSKDLLSRIRADPDIDMEVDILTWP